MDVCLVKGCENTILTENVTWYVAPTNSWKKIWEDELGQTYKANQVICSCHFPAKSFVSDLEGVILLKPGAVPKPLKDETPIVIAIADPAIDKIPDAENLKRKSRTPQNVEQLIEDSDSDEEINGLLDKYLAEKKSAIHGTQLYPKVVDLTTVRGEYLTCFVCGIYCSNASTLKAHLDNHPKNKPRKACTLCGRLYVTRCSNCPFPTIP